MDVGSVTQRCLPGAGRAAFLGDVWGARMIALTVQLGPDPSDKPDEGKFPLLSAALTPPSAPKGRTLSAEHRTRSPRGGTHTDCVLLFF